MEFVVATFWAAVLLFLLGLGSFLYYLRTRKGWAWGVAVMSLSVAILWLWMFWPARRSQPPQNLLDLDFRREYGGHLARSGNGPGPVNIFCPDQGCPLMSVLVQTVVLLCLSNVFMTFAWYAHLRDLNDKPWYIAAVASWGIALLEYLLQVPANRIGHTQLRLDQLKILQEVITLSIFIPFALFYMKRPLRLDYLWAGLCLLLAAYFVFRGDSSGQTGPDQAQSPATAAADKLQ